jgi:hypothetical protein
MLGQDGLARSKTMSGEKVEYVSNEQPVIVRACALLDPIET